MLDLIVSLRRHKKEMWYSLRRPRSANKKNQQTLATPANAPSIPVHTIPYRLPERPNKWKKYLNLDLFSIILITTQRNIIPIFRRLRLALPPSYLPALLHRAADLHAHFVETGFGVERAEAF
jgi:hypothetical protein